MADLFEFMLGKKDNKKETKVSYDEKNNYSIYMPVGVYDGSDIEDEYTGHKNDGNRDSPYDNLTSRRGDFNPYSLEKMKSEEQLVELKRQISSLDDEVRMLKDKITELKNKNSSLSVEKSKFEHIAVTYRGMVEKIIKIMPYYQDIEFTGIGTPEQWNDRKLVEIFVSCIEHIKIEYSKKIKELEELKSKRVSQEPSVDIAVQKEEPMNMNVEYNFEINQSDSIVDDNDLNELNQEIDMFSGGDDFLDNLNYPNTMNETVSISFDNEHLEKYIEKLSDDVQLKIIVETIGETGFSRVAELKETDSFKRTFVNSNGEFTQGTLSKKLQILEDIDVVNIEKINTGRKGGYENIYSLSETGRQLYKAMFSANPVESEKEAIRRQHTSLEHGYFIKTVAKELESKGYEVFDSPKDCVRKPLMANNDGDEKLRVEADLIIKKSDMEYIVECEMGTTSDSDMNKKLDKLILVTNVVSFIMNNQESLNKTSAKVDKWITKKGRDNLKGYTFRFTTLDTLKKKEVWQNKGPF